MLTLIENGEIYAPEPLGRQSLLLIDGKIGKIGKIDPRAIEALDLEHEIIDANGCVVAPGLIDPHEHILGGSGESGFGSQTPEIQFTEIVGSGITTVVGVLGVDTTMKTMAALLGKAKGLKEEGLTAFIWSGGYTLPPTSITPSVRDDIMFIEEVIGAGELAIADKRAMAPRAHELARVATDAYVGGKLSQKAGVLHLHVGEGEARLSVLREVLDEYEVEASCLYPTHVERNEKLMQEAIDLARRGAFVDIDVVMEDLPKWLQFYLDHGGDPRQLTASSDANSISPRTLYEQICKCIVEHALPLELVLALVTENTSRVLKLEKKGKLEVGRDADVLILRQRSLDIVHVIARGQIMIRDGKPVKQESYLKKTNRSFQVLGQKE